MLVCQSDININKINLQVQNDDVVLCIVNASWHLFVQSQHWKHLKYVWNIFKVKNKDKMC